MMTQMTAFQPMDAHDPEHPPATGPAAPFSIKCMGRRPIEFHGVELCMAMSFAPGAPMWFEINIYRTLAQGFVVCVRHFHRDEDQQDLVRAWEHDDFEAVMTTLEGYDPADDLRVDVDPADPGLALPDLAAHALALRARAGEARRQYAALVGEILHDLDAG